MIVDLHVHTSHRSGDSNLSPEELVEEARRIGLDGACLTEHNVPWDRFEFRRFASQQDSLLLVPAMEVETEVGHIAVFGLEQYVSGIRDPREMRRVVDDVGGYMVLVHPFRNLFQDPPFETNLLFRDRNHQPRTVEEVLDHPIFELIDAIEVANGANTDAENLFAWEVARRLQKPVVGGSDAHSVNGLGKYVTVFPEPISSPEAFVQALHNGGFYPATRPHAGKVQWFPDGSS